MMSPDYRLTPSMIRLLQACIDLDTTCDDQLSKHLGLTQRTIQTEFRNITGRLEVSGRGAAIIKVAKLGILNIQIVGYTKEE